MKEKIYGLFILRFGFQNDIPPSFLYLYHIRYFLVLRFNDSVNVIWKSGGFVVISKIGIK